MIYTLGCSFTKWYWPTWADWLGAYRSQPIKNLAGSGWTNDLIYYQLLQRANKITQHSEVYIMWTGSNRVCEWYDRDSIDQRDCQDFFPDTDGQLWFTHREPYQGLYRSHPDRLPSLSHMQIEMFNTILQTQLLLNQVGCKYQMMFWQNPWCDCREIFRPSFHLTWPNKSSLTTKEVDQALSVLELPVIQSIINQVDWKKFVAIKDDLDNPASYNGLWEYTLSSKDLVSFAHQTDAHPNTLAQHDWAFDFLCEETDPHLRASAKKLALELINIDIPPYDRQKAIWDLVDH